MEIMQIFHSEPTVEFKLCQKAVPNNNSPIYIVYLLKKSGVGAEKNRVPVYLPDGLSLAHSVEVKRSCEEKL